MLQPEGKNSSLVNCRHPLPSEIPSTCQRLAKYYPSITQAHVFGIYLAYTWVELGNPLRRAWENAKSPSKKEPMFVDFRT